MNNEDFKKSHLDSLSFLLIILIVLIILIIFIIYKLTIYLALIPYSNLCHDLGYYRMTDFDSSHHLGYYRMTNSVSIFPDKIECDGHIIEVCYTKDKWGHSVLDKPIECDRVIERPNP